MFHLRGVGNNNDHHNLIRVNFVEVIKCGSDVCVYDFFVFTSGELDGDLGSCDEDRWSFEFLEKS